MNPWIGMIFISLLTGFLMLLVFRYTSNQEGIKRTKNKIKAHLLEMRLFPDNMRVSFKAQGNIFLANMKYISHSAKPLLFMIIPVILVLIQVNFWFGYSSLKPREPVVLKVKLENDYNLLEVDLNIAPSSGISIETPPLRIEEENEINWRISPLKKGVYNLEIYIDGQKVSKQVSVAQTSLSKISPKKLKGNFFDGLFFPLEAPIKKSSPVKSIEILYPDKSLPLFGINFHWLIAFFGLSIILGFAFKGVFGVEI
jgi:hypothetical protein